MIFNVIESEVFDQAVATFKASWKAADALGGQEGHRVEQALVDTLYSLGIKVKP